MNTKNKSSHSNWLNQLEISILAATAIICIVVTLLDFLGALDSIPWLKDRVPVLILLSVGLIASYIILERRSQLQTIHNDLLDRTESLSHAQEVSEKFIIRSLQGVAVKSFDSDADCLKYMNERVAQAEKRVDDISWSSETKTTPGFDREKALDEEYREIITQHAHKVIFNEVLIFHNKPGRIQKLRNRIKDKWPGYSCVYFEDVEIPLVQFMIIDGEEVIILSDLKDTRNLAIQHPDIVGFYKEYYKLLWDRGRKLISRKDGIYWDEVEKILGESEVQLLKKAT